MALYSRKLLLAKESGKKPESEKKYASSCYMCYICPDECYVPPPPPPPPPPSSQSQASASQKHQMSTILMLMLCVLGAAFLVLSYLTIRRYRNCRRRDSASPGNGSSRRQDFLDENHGPVVDHHIWYIRTVGLPESVIDSIAVFKYRKGEGLIEGSDCSVCLSEFQEDESLRLLPKCSHAFHVPCIDTWLRSHKNCPVCRAPIMISNSNNNNDNNNVRVNSLETSTNLPDLGSDEENHQRQNELETHNEVEMDELIETRRRISYQEDKIADLISKTRCDFDSRIEKFRVLSDLADHRVRVDQELQPVRRSVSMDFSSMISTKKDEGCSDTKLESVEKQNSDMIVKRGCENSSIYRMMIKSSSSLQRGPISMKRSFSFSGKRSLRKNSRSQESVTIIG